MRKTLVFFLISMILIGCAKLTREVKAPEEPLILLKEKDIPSFDNDLIGKH